MTITILDRAGLYVYNKAGWNISSHDAREILYQLKKVEGNPKEMVRNRAAFEALHNKIHGTKIKKII
ncbi:hypothetical protein [Erwinia pyrifoliae]|uniref:hypothetical protein n=1 Tax=Erwinia pyrifoliae TaxID=79967 RepID=UPI00059C6AF3|nr:hypothetical protein [Erwinia pyrifoliae]